jgi:hypothetical protein
LGVTRGFVKFLRLHGEIALFAQNVRPFLERAFSSQDQIHGRDKASAFAKTPSGALGVLMVFEGHGFQGFTPLCAAWLISSLIQTSSVHEVI